MTGFAGDHDSSCADFIDRIVYMLDNELDDDEVVAVKLHLDVAGQPFLAKVDEHRYAELAKAEGSDVTVTWDAADAQLLEL